MLPVRVTVKVNAVLPLLPSFRLAFAAAIDRVGEGGGRRAVHREGVELGVLDVAGRRAAGSDLDRQRAVVHRHLLGDRVGGVGADLGVDVDVLQRRQRLAFERHVEHALTRPDDAGIDLGQQQVDLIGAVGDGDLVGVAAARRPALVLVQRIVGRARDAGRSSRRPGSPPPPVVGPASAWNTMPLLAVTWPPPTFTAVTRVGVPELSSLRMVLVAVAVPMVVPALGLDSVTVKFSLGSTVASPATLTVIVLLVSPAAKLTVPVGKAPPVKSAATAGLAPLPVTA